MGSIIFILPVTIPLITGKYMALEVIYEPEIGPNGYLQTGSGSSVAQWVERMPGWSRWTIWIDTFFSDRLVAKSNVISAIATQTRMTSIVAAAWAPYADWERLRPGSSERIHNTLLSYFDGQGWAIWNRDRLVREGIVTSMQPTGGVAMSVLTQSDSVLEICVPNPLPRVYYSWLLTADESLSGKHAAAAWLQDAISEHSPPEVRRLNPGTLEKLPNEILGFAYYVEQYSGVDTIVLVARHSNSKEFRKAFEIHPLFVPSDRVP